MPTETELEIIAASLSESAMRYHLLVENIPAKLIRYDLKRQKYVYLNTKTFWTGTCGRSVRSRMLPPPKSRSPSCRPRSTCATRTFR